MAIYTDLIAYSTTAAKTETAMTGSPYSPKLTGRLLKLHLVLAGGAVTALIEGVYCKLSCSKWGIDQYVFATGGGLRTAPAVPIPIGEVDVDLPVETGVNLTVVTSNFTADTPVTPEIYLFGTFEG
jgi:hypothetical protein